MRILREKFNVRAKVLIGALFCGLVGYGPVANAGVVTLGIDFTNDFTWNGGHAVKIERGPAEMGGFLTGPFTSQTLSPPFNSQFAFASGSFTSQQLDFTFNFTVDDFGRPGADALG